MSHGPLKGYKLCSDCRCPILKKGQRRKHPDAYRHAQGCSRVPKPKPRKDTEIIWQPDVYGKTPEEIAKQVADRERAFPTPELPPLEEIREILSSDHSEDGWCSQCGDPFISRGDGNECDPCAQEMLWDIRVVLERAPIRAERRRKGGR